MTVEYHGAIISQGPLFSWYGKLVLGDFDLKNGIEAKKMAIQRFNICSCNLDVRRLWLEIEIVIYMLKTYEEQRYPMDPVNGHKKTNLNIVSAIM